MQCTTPVRTLAYIQIAADSVFSSGNQIALFIRFSNNLGLFALQSNPFTSYTFDSNSIQTVYDPFEYFVKGQIDNTYISDRFIVGIYALSAYQIVSSTNYVRDNSKSSLGTYDLWKHPMLKGMILPTNIDPQKVYKGFNDDTYTNLAERDAVIAVVEQFLMDKLSPL